VFNSQGYDQCGLARVHQAAANKISDGLITKNAAADRLTFASGLPSRQET
jgi:hypothetical protein